MSVTGRLFSGLFPPRAETTVSKGVHDGKRGKLMPGNAGFFMQVRGS
jgi:hypothetical protein